MKLKIFAGVLILGLIARIEYLGNNLREAEVAAEQAQSNLSELQSAVSRVQEQQVSFNSRTIEIDREFNEMKTELEGSARGREDVVMQRPTLVQRMVNRAFQEQQQKIACLTDGSCEEGEEE